MSRKKRSKKSSNAARMETTERRLMLGTQIEQKLTEIAASKGRKRLEIYGSPQNPKVIVMGPAA